MVIGDGANTGWDLAFNLAGVAAPAVWLATSGGARRSEPGDERVSARGGCSEQRLHP